MRFDFKRAITENWPIKVTAFTLAGLLWAVVRAGEPTTQLVPVTVEIVPPPGMVVSQQLPPVQALFSGSTRELFRLYTAQPKVQKTVPPGFDGGSYPVELSLQDLNLTTEVAVAVQDLQPRAFEVLLDSLLTRAVPVAPEIAIVPDPNFEQFGRITFTPESVQVAGAAGAVRGLAAVRTVSLDLEGVRDTVFQRVAVDTSMLRNLRVSPTSVQIVVPIRPITNGTRVLPNVDVNVEPRRGGVWVAVTPQVRVTVMGPTSRIGRLTRDSVNVTAGPIGFGPMETVPLVISAPDGISASAVPDSVVVRRRDRA